MRGIRASDADQIAECVLEYFSKADVRTPRGRGRSSAAATPALDPTWLLLATALSDGPISQPVPVQRRDCCGGCFWLPAQRLLLRACATDLGLEGGQLSMRADKHSSPTRRAP
jgi:hypothetical protein